MLLDFVISSAKGLYPNKKIFKMMSIYEEYHKLVQELHRENDKLQQTTFKDKKAILLKIATNIHGSTNEVENLCAIYLQT